ncbi:hypothetical protein [Delftia phage PhiW-14]|uniref:Uncharacterized protein n=1 Tax=Delftia phage PhiW-14 TaxID=665032 RepID=C9DG88_BPW14|nr:hypothetical protein DP-phiW-14_gp118 [Delftia phage PhiW-14]ACV50139.1 hypothetical protein [Delftia phage PhiW-14]
MARKKNYMKAWASYAHKNYICHRDVAHPTLTLRQRLLMDDYDIKEMAKWVEKELGKPVPDQTCLDWKTVQDVVEYMEDNRP